MLGIQRLNAKKTQPNLRIIFIKPLKGKDEAIAQDFLERIAAQCRMQIYLHPLLLLFFPLRCCLSWLAANLHSSTNAYRGNT